MKHVFWIASNRLAGRCGPDYQPWDLLELRAAGFDAILNLSETAPAYAEFETAQLEVAWFPLPNTCPADIATEEECQNALPPAHQFLQSQLEAERKVLVHCAWGRDRTGLLLAHHLTCSTGVAPEEAIARVRQVCPKAITAPGWEEMATRLIARLLPR